MKLQFENMDEKMFNPLDLLCKFFKLHKLAEKAMKCSFVIQIHQFSQMQFLILFLFCPLKADNIQNLPED